MSKKTLFVLIVLAAVSVILAACTASSSTASCAFVVGNGRSGEDSKLHKIIYPGQQVTYDTDSEVVSYVPCNSRNYIVNDGTQRNANGDKVGDRDVLIEATTKSGVPIFIGVRALWTLNQSEDAMRLFYDNCFKYNCASKEDVGGDTNFATKGWNGMLAENFGPALEASARQASSNIDDSIWIGNNQEQYKALGDGMSAVFADNMRANLGYPIDLFCGSGNSTWSDPNNPGVGTFTCSPVRIVVDSVKRGAIQESENTEGAANILAKRLENAKALYGDNAQYWLALQDTIEKCKGSNSTCIFNIGSQFQNPMPVYLPTPIPQVAQPVEATPTPGQ